MRSLSNFSGQFHWAIIVRVEKNQDSTEVGRLARSEQQHATKLFIALQKTIAMNPNRLAELHVDRWGQPVTKAAQQYRDSLDFAVAFDNRDDRHGSTLSPNNSPWGRESATRSGAN